MSPEEEQFFQSLRAVSIHMIKHVQPIYKYLLPLLEAHEKGEWTSLPRDEQRQQLETLAGQFEEDGEITKYFAAYPHKWSRERYAKMRADLANYLRVLRDQ